MSIINKLTINGVDYELQPSNIDILQTTGNSETAVMSQKAVTDAIQTVVDDVKAMVKTEQNVIDNADFADFEAGYIDASGVFQSTNNWRCSDFIPVREEDKVIYKLSGGTSVNAIAFYDEDEQYISGITGTQNSNYENPYVAEGTITIEEGIAFIRCSALLSPASNPTLYGEQNVVIETSEFNEIVRAIYSASEALALVNSRVDEVEEDMQDAEEDIDECIEAIEQNQANIEGIKDALQFESTTYDRTDPDFEAGYIDASGVFQSTNGWRCSDFIPVLEGDKIGYKLSGNPNVNAIAFYDEDEQYISGVTHASTANWENEYTAEGTETVGEGIAYVRITFLMSPDSAPTLYSEQNAVIETNVFNQMNANANGENEELRTTEHYDYDALKSQAYNGYLDLNGGFVSTNNWKSTDFIPVSAGDKILLKLTTYEHVSAVAFYDLNHNFVSNLNAPTWSWGTSLYPLDGAFYVPENVCFMRVAVFTADYADEQFVTIHKNVLNDLKNNINIINGSQLNVLVLGDSYSEANEWIYSMREVIPVKSVVNLAVGSATIKDVYADRSQYPYNSRPASRGGNSNTLSCQIEKLKRLMAGQDLDSGESKIYSNPSEYPNIIIIEGGMNDSPDEDDVVNTYQEQFLVAKTAYYKANASAQVTNQTVYVKPALDEIDRTCFAGAYRYLCEELIALFPNAQIFITTASHMNYFATNPNVLYGKIAEQQRKCADIMSYAVIDWHAEGNLNTMMIGLNGSGTAGDPYTPVGGNAYTSDLLHPNREGAKRYGRLAGKVIKQKYLSIS